MVEDLEISSGTFIERIGSSAEVKSIVQLVPIIGPYLSEKISVEASKLGEQRLENFLNELYRAIIEIKDSSLKKDWGESEEFYDLFKIALESSMQSRSREKTRMNAKILSKVLNDDIEQVGFAESFLYSLKDLSVLEVNALATIYHAFDATGKLEFENTNEIFLSKESRWRELLLERCKIDVDDTAFIIKRLETTGLISEIADSGIGFAVGEIKINKTFNKLIKQIQ